MLIRPAICSWLAVEEEDVIAEREPDVVREGPAWNEERDVNLISWRDPPGLVRCHIELDWRTRDSGSSRDRPALSDEGEDEERIERTPGPRASRFRGDEVSRDWFDGQTPESDHPLGLVQVHTRPFRNLVRCLNGVPTGVGCNGRDLRRLARQHGPVRGQDQVELPGGKRWHGLGDSVGVTVNGGRV